MPVSKKEQCVFTTLRTGLPRQAAKVNAENRARTLFSFFGECMREMVLFCAQDQAEELAEALLDFGVLSVSVRSEEHTSELQSRGHLVCRLLLEKKKILQ